MDNYQINEILEDHRLWLDTGGAKGVRANFERTSLDFIKLNKKDLRRANFQGASLLHANLREANLQEANFTAADLSHANLKRASLQQAHLNNARLLGANMEGANLCESKLQCAQLIETDLSSAILTGSSVYGVSVWSLKVNDRTNQANLVITRDDEPHITVDDLEVAQFIYLLLNNQKIRSVIDNVTAKTVLILGRFTTERKAVLDAIRSSLRVHGLLPILFDFDKPASRTILETVSTLARLSRFIIADITEPKSIPQELVEIVKGLPSVPVQPILQRGHEPWSMFESVAIYPWVLLLVRYRDLSDLLENLQSQVLVPAEQKAHELAQRLQAVRDSLAAG